MAGEWESLRNARFGQLACDSLDQVLGLMDHLMRMRTTQAGVSILGGVDPARTEGA
jgi:hypothetical protein